MSDHTDVVIERRGEGVKAGLYQVSDHTDLVIERRGG